MNPSLDSILKFANLLQQYRAIERRILIQNSDRLENDVEHSYSLAMLAWYIHSTYKLDLNIDKLLTYALAHDLVEVYAGDTFFYRTSTADIENKHEKETAAAIKLKQEFPEFPELHRAIENYESREDKESKFIYALDKIEPIFSIYLDKGRTWKKENITLEMLTSMKSEKVAIDKTVESIFNELIEHLTKEQDILFVE